MDLSLFKRSLCDALIKRGIDADTAQHHVASLVKTFTEDDIAEISSYGNTNASAAVDSIAESIADVLKKGKKTSSPAKTSSSAPAPVQKTASVSAGVRDDAATAQFTAQRSSVKTATQRQAPQRNSRPAENASIRRNSPQASSQPKTSRPDSSRGRGVTPPQKAPARTATPAEGEKGKLIFWTVFWCALPITVFLALVFFGIFAFMYAAVSAAIVLLVIALVAVIASGSVISLISFIYGIIKLFSVMPEGMYEIGLGFIVMGITMFAGIVIYNIAVRLLPIIFPYITKLYGYTVLQIKALYYYLKEECYKL